MNRIQLSRPRSTSCCMASVGPMYAHISSDVVGWSSWKNCVLKRAAVEVWRGGDLPKPPPGPQWSVTFADGRSSTCAVHAVQRTGVDEGLRLARIQESNTVGLHGNKPAVDFDFGGEGRVNHRYCTGNTTKPWLGEHGRLPTGVGSRHHSKSKTSPPWSDGTFGRESG